MITGFNVRLTLLAGCIVPGLVAPTALGHHLPDKDVVTLYRNATIAPGAKMHIATFDASDLTRNGTAFQNNWHNCVTSAKLRMAQPGVDALYWCEKGYGTSQKAP